MKPAFRNSLLLAACLAAIVGCDSKPTAPVEAPPEPVAAAPGPPQPLTAAAILAALDAAELCKLFGVAVSTGEKKIATAGCVATPGASDVALATDDSGATLTASLVREGSSVTVAAPLVSPAAAEDAAHGGWSNVGMVFVGEAPTAKDLCMKVDYFAPDGNSNSLFVTRLGEPSTAFNLASNKTETISSDFPEPVIKAGKSSAFALSRREPGTVVKAVSFAACP